MSTNTHPDLIQAVESLRSEMARLSDRLVALEKKLGAAPVPAADPSIDQHTILIIAAAVAGFLGKKAPIRQIRLLGSEAWAQQGRVTIQASHSLLRHG